MPCGVTGIPEKNAGRCALPSVLYCMYSTRPKTATKDGRMEGFEEGDGPIDCLVFPISKAPLGAPGSSEHSTARNAVSHHTTG